MDREAGQALVHNVAKESDTTEQMSTHASACARTHTHTHTHTLLRYEPSVLGTRNCGYIHFKHHAPVEVKEAKLEKVGSDPEDPWCPAKTPDGGYRV